VVEPLRLQEERVLRLLVAGRSNPEIVAELVVSVNTVKTHVQNIYRKLNVSNRVEASEVARHLQLI
jgi:LuxR family maltose regulon positive regulatory protein